MTDNTSLVNLALQSFGSRTTITAAQLLAGSNNEAKQANLTFANTRDSLLRLAPWDCAMKTANLVYITSTPGTPENTSPATNLWAPGQPRPPWAYEYQYPVDCLKACWIIPATQTGFTGVPITTAVTGGAPATWLGGAIRFKVAIDEFFMWSSAIITNGGSGYIVNDIITALPVAATVDITNKIGTFLAGAPQGAGAKFRVTEVDINGAVLDLVMVNQIEGGIARSGSYFFSYTGPVIYTTTGSGSGIVLEGDVTNSSVYSQRVILTNQEYATLAYVKQVTDPNVWDPMFQDAFVNALGGDICLALTSDKGLAKTCYAKTNALIEAARNADGNEGLTVNDITPDWIRGRGITWNDTLMSGPYSNFDWGGGYGNLA